MSPYDPERLEPNFDHYTRAWEANREAERALIRFWLIGNGSGAALSFNLLANFVNQPVPLLYWIFLVPPASFLLGLLFAWLALGDRVDDTRRWLQEWDAYVRNEEDNDSPPLMPPAELIGFRRKFLNWSAGFLLTGVTSGFLSIILNISWIH